MILQTGVMSYGGSETVTSLPTKAKPASGKKDWKRVFSED